MSLIETPTDVRKFQMYIGGKWVDSTSGKTFPSENPATGKIWAEISEANAADVDQAVRAARAAFESGPWSDMTGSQRRDLLLRFAQRIAEEGPELGRIEATENGKLLREMVGQYKLIPEYYRFFAGLADKIQGETIPMEKPQFFGYTIREPLGVIGLIVPWNSPLLLVSFVAAPALAAGNTLVIKPAEQTPVSALRYAELATEVGFPPGVINVVPGYGEIAGAALASHPDVNKLFFTGSTETGKLIAAAAAKNVVPLGLELGGKSPQIVFEDADLQSVTFGLLAGIFAAAGQTCIAGSRLFVHRRVRQELVERIVGRAKTIKMGDPFQEDTELGPLAFREAMEKTEYFVEKGIEEGATMVLGGRRPENKECAGGYYFLPTIFTDVRNDMTIAREEIFGPILSVLDFEEEEEVIRLANDTRYGLAAGIWTRDIMRAHRVARRLKAGTVWINEYRQLSPAMPFGGYKLSGYGRECGSQAIHEMTQLKSVWVELQGKSRDPFRLA
ncbi:MAG: aldehyde dehydrogenase [Acidobacteria bacterium]|nr:aldehyde dehydrogenase [Acidobacteriota bacterium]MCI0721890.1 aldehyde dehydrogenase [Acidobacteriota bacterium]